MPTTYWTLENDGAEKKLADWGLDDVRLTRTNQAEDVAELSLNGRPFDAAFLWAFKSEVVIRRDRTWNSELGTFSGGSQWFVGLVARPRAAAAGRREGQACALIGPWWYLNERGFEQEYQIFTGWTDNDPTKAAILTTKTSNRVFLNQSPALPGGGGMEKLTTGEQLTEILAWTLKPFTDAGAAPPFQIGTIALDVDPPIDEVKNITCAEAARKMFRWSPDAVAWFDYTTTPPTFHAQRRADLTVFNLDLSVIRPTDLAVNPRPELQRPFVKINYERTNTVNGFSFLEIIKRQYPDPAPSGALAQFGGVPFVVDLRGYTNNRIIASLEVAALDFTNRDWWLNNCPELRFGLQTGRLTSVEIDWQHRTQPAKYNSSIEYQAQEDGEPTLVLPNQLVGGTPAEWIAKNFQRQKASCNCRIQTNNGGVVEDKTLTVQYLATDATTGNYSLTTDNDAGDPIPVDLEKDFYEALNQPFFDGSLSFRRAEVGGLPTLGNKLNLTGSAQTDWATMDALVQRVTESVQAGQTEIEFGTPPHLDLGDLISLFIVTRNRQRTQPVNFRAGQALNNGAAQFTPDTANTNSTHADGNPTTIVASGSVKTNESDPNYKGRIEHDAKAKQSKWSGAADEGSVTMKLAPAGQANTTQGRNLTFHEIEVCETKEDGTKELFTRLFLCSDRYKKAGQ